MDVHFSKVCKFMLEFGEQYVYIISLHAFFYLIMTQILIVCTFS